MAMGPEASAFHLWQKTKGETEHGIDCSADVHIEGADQDTG